jgi:adenylate kinase
VEFNPPSVPGICDIDGSELYQRQDDLRATVLERIEIYKRETAPLIEYFRTRDLLREVDGGQAIQEVTTTVLKQLDQQVGT